MKYAQNFDYSTIYDECLNEFNRLGLTFNFDDNPHLNEVKDIEGVYQYFVYHSQNRRQGGAINFFTQPQLAADVWACIKSFTFESSNKYSYIKLFEEFSKLPNLTDTFQLNKGKDIQFLELAKTCQCINSYLSEFKTLKNFVDKHKFTENAKDNLKKIKNVAAKIYNMGVTLVLDFFKELDCIVGREYLVKPDIHVKRFFMELFNNYKLSDEAIYTEILEMYNNYLINNNCPAKDKTPYKLDKMIYLIGLRANDPQKSIAFSQKVRNMAKI